MQLPLRSARSRFALFGAILSLVTMAWPSAALASSQVPIDPTTIPKFVEPLPLPGALDGTTTSAANPLVIRMSEFQQKVLPVSFYAGLPAPYDAGTYLWGYNNSYPGPTVVAQRGTATHVKYVNDLATSTGDPLFLQQNLKVDQTIHWADPLGTGHSMDAYMGPVPAAVHLHGTESPSAFDGGPDAWWTSGLALKGPGFVTDQYTYPNQQEATTLFYHDHALGMTRLNVYAGLAGFYLILDPAREPANLPGGPDDRPADRYGNPFQVGMAFQDRMFDTDGQLHFPSDGINPEHPFWVPEFFGDVMLVNGKSWPYMNVEPRRYRLRWVNGSNARFYAMTMKDVAANRPGPVFFQIGSDGGLLDISVPLNLPFASVQSPLILAPGERADLIIDFSRFAGRTLTLLNSANAPYPNGDPVDPNTVGQVMQFRVGDAAGMPADRSLNPLFRPFIRNRPIERFPIPPVTRALTLNENMGAGGPLAVFVNNTMWDMETTENLGIGDTETWEIINLTADTHPMHLHLFQYQMVSRQAFDAAGYMAAYGMPMPGEGPPFAYNQRDAVTGNKLGGNPDVAPFLLGRAVGPDLNERGWKDTFRMNPGEVTRVVVRVAPQDGKARARAMGVRLGPGVNTFPFEPWMPMGSTDSFGYPGGPGYVWHCHIVDHEDNEMMRRLAILGPQPALADEAAMGHRSEEVPSPATVELAQSRPNPTVGHTTTIRFSLPARMDADLDVYDVNGRQVRVLASGSFEAGSHSFVWDGRDSGGNLAAPGAYFYRLRAGAESFVRKLVLLP